MLSSRSPQVPRKQWNSKVLSLMAVVSDLISLRTTDVVAATVVVVAVAVAVSVETVVVEVASAVVVAVASAVAVASVVAVVVTVVVEVDSEAEPHQVSSKPIKDRLLPIQAPR